MRGFDPSDLAFFLCCSCISVGSSSPSPGTVRNAHSDEFHAYSQVFGRFQTMGCDSKICMHSPLIFESQAFRWKTANRQTKKVRNLILHTLLKMLPNKGILFGGGGGDESRPLWRCSVCRAVKTPIFSTALTQ